MFESFTLSKEDAINILKSDHEKVKGLFDQFEKAESRSEKKKIVAQAIMELKIHAEIEEKIFYPTVRAEVDNDLMNEADEEHHVAKLLIAELEQMDPSDDHWEAKFTVLSENIRHHIKEEEGEMLPQARRMDIDFNALNTMGRFEDPDTGEVQPGLTFDAGFDADFWITFTGGPGAPPKKGG